MDYLELHKQYLGGKSANQIAKENGVTAGNILYFFRKLNLPVRSASDAIKLSRTPEVISKISKTWFKKGLVPWCKGLTKNTDERIKKIAISISGENHHSWKGGRVFSDRSSGTMYYNRNGLHCIESHKVWCEHNNFGCIPKGCEIHHIDLNPKNNSIDNLILLPIDYHHKLHWQMRINKNPNAKYFGKNQGMINNG